MHSAALPRLISKKEQVCEFILEQIAAGLAVDDQIWTEHTYADRLGVSKSTVRKAVEELVAAGVIYQVQGRGTFVQDAGHPQVEKRKRQALRLIGYVSPYIHDDRFMREITLGVEEALDGDRFLLMHKHIHLPEMNEAEVLPKLSAKVQGMIILSTMTPEAQVCLDELHAQGYPIVYIDRYPADKTCNFVVSDNQEVGLMATDYLLSLGHERILHVTHSCRMTSVDQREEGYRVAMTRAGLEPSVRSTAMESESIVPLVDDLLKEGLPTGIFCVNDGMAKRVCSALVERNVRIPEDVSIIGVDNNPDAAESEIPLTTIAQPKYQMGFKAARLLMERMVGKGRPGKGIYLQPTLVERASSGPRRPS